MANDSSQQQQPADDIWLRILQEVNAKNNTAIQGSVLILGNERSGKSALIKRLTRGERPGQNSMLEYNFLQIQADADASYAYQLGGGAANGLLGPTDSANLPIWVLDGKEECTPLVKFSFPPSLAKCILCLCASLDQSGNILPALSRWYRLIDEQIRQHYQPEEIVQAKQTQIRFWQEYMEPIESMHHSTVTLAESNATIVGSGTGTNNGNDLADSSPLLLPPEKGVLEENCGAIVIVVITKSDLYTDLGTEQLDKIQYHVRKFCLRHGAALVYTSAKEDLNTQLLHKYIAHRIYSLPFTTPAYIVEKDRIFVPMGWDSDQKLSIIKETLGSNLDVPMLPQQSDPTPFSNYKSSAEKEIEAEDEQSFLNRLTSIALDGPQGGTGQQSPRRAGESGAGKAPGDNTMLANFFSSLLKEKDHQKSSPASSIKSGHGGTVSPLAGTGSNIVPSNQPYTTSTGPAPVEGMDDDGNNDNEEFEDAPEGDESDFSSSINSQQNVTPRMDGESEIAVDKRQEETSQDVDEKST